MFETKRFRYVVVNAWSITLYGDLMAILCRKLQLTKRALVALNKRHDMVCTNVEIARSELHSIQEQLVTASSNPHLLSMEKCAISKLNQALDMEESLFKQKSRINWLHLGDDNTKFFFN